MSISCLTSITALSMLAIAGTASADIYNCDFSTTANFTSPLSFVPPADIYSEGTYGVVNSFPAPNTLHPNWASFADHTNDLTADPDRRFMVVNGSTTAPGPNLTWQSTSIALSAGSYNLSGWFANLYPEAIASLQFRVIDAMGSSVGSGTYFTPNDGAASPTQSGVWNEHLLGFSVTAPGSYKLQIWNQNILASGNDFAIDDIRLTSVVPLPAPVWGGIAGLAGVGCLAAVRRRRMA